MLSTRWDEVKSVFEAALLREEQEREAFVSSRCGGDLGLAREVHQLLLADRESSNFLEPALYPSANLLIPPTEERLLKDGDVLCGRFKVLSYLGEGGMGQVYRCADLELRQDIALKAIRPEIAGIPGVLSRFRREVNATRRVTHPNVCRTFDLETHNPSPEEGDRFATPITFLTMELLVGETLAERIRREGPLPLDQLRIFAEQVAQALQAAHSAGVIHCDLKPANIFVTGPEGESRYVVTDFGIAKFTNPQDSLSLTTIPGSAVEGTPFYMAPEQLENGAASVASDIYSFGLVLYEALTGQRLSLYHRSGSGIRTALVKVPAEAETPKTMTTAWIDVVARCVLPTPADRFANVEEILELLACKPPLAASALPTGAIQGTTELSAKDRKGEGFIKRWRPRSWPVRALIASGALLTAAVLWVAKDKAGLHPIVTTYASSVAIMPIVDTGADSHMAALAKGITLSLTNDLAQVSGLRVPSQSTVSDLGKATDMESIRRKLSVDAVVNGTIVNVGDSRLQMELVDVRTGFQLWSQSYTLKQMEEPALAEDIAREISYQIRTRSDKGLSPSRSRKHSSVPAAEAAFVQGQSALAEHTYEGFERAVKFFQQAVDADPNYAAAMAERSRSYALMAINNGRPEPPIELLNQAEATARRALRLDSTLAAAYTSLAQVEILRDYNWSGAEEDFKRAEEVEPDYIPAHLSYALHLLTARGRFAEARAQLTYADGEVPKTLGTGLAKAAADYFSRRYESSLREVEQIRNQFHTSAVAIEFEAEDYLALNSPAQALKVLVEARPDPSAPPDLRGALRGIAMARMGQRQNALAELKRLEKSNRSVDSSYYVAALCAQLGYKDKAFAYLEKSREDRKPDMLFVGVDPLMDPLRSDARFKSLLSKLNLL